jgi:hypothetical protein
MLAKKALFFNTTVQSLERLAEMAFPDAVTNTASQP